MKVKIINIEKVATVYYFVQTDHIDFPEYRRSASGCWERSFGESWETCGDEDELEKTFQEYLVVEHPKLQVEDIQPGSQLENDIYHIEYIDDHNVRLTKKASS